MVEFRMAHPASRFPSLFAAAAALGLLLAAPDRLAADELPAIHVPVRLTVEAAPRWNFWTYNQTATSANSNKASQAAFDALGRLGWFAGGEYAWQFGGLDGKKPATYLGVPLYVSMVLADPSATNGATGTFLSYGFTLRHDLTPPRPVIPFLGYALLVNQLFVNGVEGGVLGHESRLDVGLELAGDKAPATAFEPRRFDPRPFVRAGLGYTSFAELGRKERFHMMAATLVLGLSFH